jgi:hexosaminidase
MRYLILCISVVLSVAGCATAPSTSTATRNPPSLIPWPAKVEPMRGHFELRNGAALIVDSHNVEALGIARRFAEALARSRGIHLDLRPDGSAGRSRDAIVFSLDARDGFVPDGEGYRLIVDAGRIELSAREAHGLSNGSMTLLQLLTQESTPATTVLEIPALRIVDAPRFAWRGAMLDSARQYQPPEFIKRFIDELALAKLDTLHWHLTDDQGWRIEIKRYPRLTDVGAWRHPAGAAGTDAQGKPVRYGGYYTQDEIRDIVRYAAERYVTIVPEIDMPGHMQAAIAAYPELGSAGDMPQVSADWGVHSYIVNVDDSTFVFFENVLDEVIALFPGQYIHVGGDEAIKDQWKASPRIQARMHELGLANEDALQGWFIARMQKYLAAHGRKLIGWDEILEGGVPPEAAVMSWRGIKGGIEAANAGHAVVMAPSPDLYLDHLQSDGDDEPSGRPDVRTLADIYAFDPVAGLDANAARHVLGAQANLWTEHMRTTAMVEHAAFPRLAALSEVLWSPPSAHDWNGFLARLAPQMDRYRARGIAAATSAFETPAPTDALRGSSARLKQCSGKLVLRLEDDAPADGPRAFFNVDLFDPCWLFEHASLDGIAGVRVRVGQLPYNFQLGKDAANIVPRPKPQTPAGELRVMLDSCKGAQIASIPLDSARANPAVTTLDVPFAPIAGMHDLCFVFSGKGVDPLWAIDSVELHR